MVLSNINFAEYDNSHMVILNLKFPSVRAVVPNLSGTWSDFMEDNFSTDWGRKLGEDGFQDDSSTLHIVHFISIIISSTPPRSSGISSYTLAACVRESLKKVQVK